MRTLLLTVIVIALVNCATAASARHRHHSGNQARAAAMQREAQLLKRFDANGNGQLDPPERQAALAATEKMRGAGKGKLTGAAKGQAGKLASGDKAQQLKRFDKDGDGQLDANEKEAAKQALADLAAKRNK